ncbi:alpha/beta hydrolase [Tuwongella immobilis]|uniref:AB hydrolase-1 domain-containing protein n=1 Tax=Tuwongella immobilis TaxID=692036 RepID=A0A6C2YJ32_9BACT|nr:alpha/beta hydrolase [Tuwongella immobilis]VIP01095.1 Phospholipase/Carboxylesterase OS=Chthoniobacter flavus Ellin428 GN=CfE428DRAFT_1534 PE=4 SV=1: Abhydrolase_5 [Tuwongella immobilis]VTR97615.1 Phospholipase/Carboxylesterase OS=Chthoniobacter flavus Ellin428 GN=CfE428DRAFT_1534 PE=4 SV=1: Abhydrolase_5 [Tuwongella immobilis]
MTQSRWKKRMLIFIGLFVLGYLGIVIMLLSLENRLVFVVTPASEAWEPKPSEQLQDVWIAMPDGGQIHAWWNPPPAGKRETLLICHGNSGNVSFRGQTMLRFGQELQRGVLLFDYPGYGQSPGEPNEANCYDSATAAFDWLVTQQGIPAEAVTLYGESLGGGVAVEVATRRAHHALVLMKTFTNLPDAAKARYPFVPTHWLMRNRFDSLAKIPTLHQPVLVVGATDDRIVPFRLSERLFAAANEPKQLIPLPGDDHNDPLPPDFLPKLRAFLDAIPAPNAP